jgi:gliding motility-associated-like protein
MKKICCLLLILFVLKDVYSQVAIEAAVLPDARYQFVNKNTRQKVNDLVWDDAASFVNGFAKVSLNNQWGFVDQFGNPVIKTNYESARNFVNKLAAVKQNSKWGFINEKGEVVIPFEYEIVYDFKETVTAAYKNSKWFLINKSGVVIKPLDIDIFSGFKNGSARITKQGRSGIMNTKGEIISIEPEKNYPDKKNNSNALRINSSQSVPCPDNIGFEAGNFTNWNCFIGSVAGVNNTNVITVNPSPPTPNRHVIYAASNPSALDPFGLFPTNPPDGSRFALKLGNTQIRSQAERVSYRINVPANSADASITYRYAVVFQDPGHLFYEQPRFSAKLLDVLTNTYLPCASNEYVSDDALPGFFTSPVDDSVRCKAWASVFINLSAYAGRTLILEFTTADCTRGRHWGYAYVDVGDCNITAGIQYKCNPSTALLSGPPGFQFYKWWNANFTALLGTGQNVTLSPAPALSSTIHVEVIPFNGFGCSDTLDVLLNVSDPTADAGPDKSFCPGGSAAIGTNAVPGNTYSWSPATYLSDPNTASPVSTAPVSTTYILTVSNAGNGCSDKDTVDVIVDPITTPAFNPAPDQCVTGNSFTFTNTSNGGSTHNWTFGDGDSSAAPTPTHSYTTAGNYIVKLVVTGTGGCKDSISHPVKVNPNPAVVTNKDFSICRGDRIQLTSTGAAAYQWTPAQGLTCNNCANPTASPAVTTTYMVKGISNAGCPGYDTLNITVFQPIQITVSPDLTICEKDSLKLFANGASSYIWWPAQGLNSSTIANPAATPNSTTKYRVIGFDGHNCFTDTGYINITVNPKPTIELGPNQTLSTGTIFPINPVTTNGPIVSWQWYPATNLSCTNCPDPSATIKKDITYHSIVKNIYGCTASDSITIHTFCANSQIFIPTAFSPDGDGINDILMVRAKGIESVRSFRIYSRWGELIFEKNNFSPNLSAFGWDGKIKGVIGSAEVYVYTAEVTCDNLQTIVIKGNVSILK